MNRNEIEDMAREAGFGTVDTRILEHFATLVAAAEREACARIAEIAFPFHCEDLIRARGEK